MDDYKVYKDGFMDYTVKKNDRFLLTAVTIWTARLGIHNDKVRKPPRLVYEERD